MKFTLKVWRQADSRSQGRFEQYELDGVVPEMSFLEMLDYLNSQLLVNGQEPVAFDHDCREGICGCCGLYINGKPHGPRSRTTTCELYMRFFKDGSTITIEPWRSKAFPVIRDLVVDRSALDKIQHAGGYISANVGSALDANTILIPKHKADESIDGASCIGCGACVATCKNASAMLFVAARVSQYALLPQGRPEAARRAKNMVNRMEALGFGGCTNTRACEAECPKGISIAHIARLNREYFLAKLRS